MSADVLHFHTFFLFPFSVDQAAVIEGHPEIWRNEQNWFEKLDHWVTGHFVDEFASAVHRLGGWRSDPDTQFDIGSSAYQDMVFFHPFVRRAFFHLTNSDHEHEALMHRYALQPAEGSRLLYQAETGTGYAVTVEVTGLRLYMFGNGIGILEIGLEGRDILFTDALWINEMMRKIYPSSRHQIETGRIPSRMALVLDNGSERLVLAEERWEKSGLTAFRPRLSSLLLTLLHFANYEEEEFEPLLDERMVVNSFVCLNGTNLPAGYGASDDYEQKFSRLLYVDQDGPGYRYDMAFTQKQMRKQVYRRWQHEGTLYGMTSYSSATCTLSTLPLCPSAELVYRNFRSQNHLMLLIALFYRATLLDFSKEASLVSRQLLPVFSGQIVQHRDLQFATRLMANYHYFNNYWFFGEPTTKDEELEHFQLLCSAYRLQALRDEIQNEIDKLAKFIDRLYALRSNDAVNRLAMISVILGIGALVTGYYGMNIPHLMNLLAIPAVSLWVLIATTIMSLASVGFIVYIVVTNWVDYRASLMPRRYRKTLTAQNLRRLKRPRKSDQP